MFRSLVIMAAMPAMATSLLVASGARAQEDTDFNPCAGLRGQAYGLCTAYTKGMDCSSENPSAPQGACENVAAMFTEVSGYPPPSACPCDFSLERISDSFEGWTSPEYVCFEEDNFTPPTVEGPGSGLDYVSLSNSLIHSPYTDVH
jgi:hypothetical protein